MPFVNFERIAADLPTLEKNWRDAARCGPAFVVIDGLLHSSREKEIFDDFPPPSWSEWENISDTLQSKKLSSERIDRFPVSLATLVHELNSGPMIRLLEALTGISGLLPDPHLWGGGLHTTKPGGYLWPHIDFLHGQQATLTRIVNLIVYTHPRWEGEMGGAFQVWKGGAVAHSIPPMPGRCVILQTDSFSVHGVSQVKGDLDRRSVALFYYTIASAEAVAADSTTGWQLHQTPPGAIIGELRRRFAAVLMRASVGLRMASTALNRKAERVMTGGQSRG